MTEPLQGDARRRMAAAAVVLALIVLAIVLAVLLREPAGSPPQPAAPSTSPGASTSPGPAASGASPSTAQPSPSQPVEPSTETPEAGQDPVQPPATVPPVPVPPSAPDAGPGPAPDPGPPAAPFPSALLRQDLTAIPNAGRVVALTFDAGANAAGLPKILSTLSAKGVTGTFFLTGNWVEANPGGVGQIVSAGHRVANHSMTHPGFTGLDGTQIARQVRGAEQTILAAGGDPRPLFRFPFGERDARTIAAVNSLGYVAVRWTVDTLGWKGTSGGVTAQAVADRTLAALQPGEIVLMHIGSNPDDGSTLDADALPDIIDRVSAAGYGFATLDALLAP
ncbi:peptidoglycan/xylan/chitin deacetylase (PgdA/CDA1 family) [Pseudarthrobacter oxydans]|uniref:Peptidoglycan/xylan/chitin deacetylase (PgdA/CDA1 family) n=1 Tax=Pseudarthrobacter oxydans TaxID=1671 RepID=A0AAW8NDK4_PSEOX|nr:polysaccharide deacetylase family protein [Pseudarthrobacter oxydans]MDR6793204.1 peptidoglycan/xylan/chitin deacetylase (PgdA/CDA1 family) [Pseudarthrobacter oxydans]MDR7164267.1 peptidoglycan/xylan/chitin deacetylase (PgdA/CDA1 family) [Pseudarthrobacter oxydans]